MSLQPAAWRRVVGLLTEILSISLANFPVLLAVSLLAEIPLFVTESVWGRAEYPQYPGMVFLGSMAFGLRSGFAVHLVAGALEGRRVGRTGSLRAGVAETLEAINMTTVFSGIQWVAFVAILAPGELLSHIQPEALFGARFVFWVTGLWLAAIFGMCIPLSIEERASEPESLRRSALLSRGHRGELAVLLALFAGFELGANGLIASELARHLVLAVIGAFGAPVLSVVYFHLHRDQKLRSVEALAAVFD